MVRALSPQTKRKRTLKWTQQTEKKDTHGCPFVASSSASHSRLQKDRGVHKWNLKRQFITLSHFFYLYLYVRSDVRFTVAWQVQPCSLVEMYIDVSERSAKGRSKSLCVPGDNNTES